MTLNRWPGINSVGLKNAARFLSMAASLPLFAYCRFASYLGYPTGAFQTCSQITSIIPSRVGVYFRAAWLHLIASDVNQNVVIGFMTLLSNPDLTIGTHVYVGAQCNIGSCTIGDDCLLGSGVHVLSGKNQHHFADAGTLIRNQGGVLTKINIGKNCWIGNNSTVMADIGDNSIVAAGSVVVDNVPAGSIVAGNPARILKHR